MGTPGKVIFHSFRAAAAGPQEEQYRCRGRNQHKVSQGAHWRGRLPMLGPDGCRGKGWCFLKFLRSCPGQRGGGEGLQGGGSPDSPSCSLWLSPPSRGFSRRYWIRSSSPPGWWALSQWPHPPSHTHLWPGEGRGRRGCKCPGSSWPLDPTPSPAFHLEGEGSQPPSSPDTQERAWCKGHPSPAPCLVACGGGLDAEAAGGGRRGRLGSREERLPRWSPRRSHCRGHKWWPAPPGHHTALPGLAYHSSSWRQGRGKEGKETGGEEREWDAERTQGAPPGTVQEMATHWEISGREKEVREGTGEKQEGKLEGVWAFSWGRHGNESD